MDPNRILILDFGSQYTQLIARRVREARVYSVIEPCAWPVEKIRAFQPKGIILSGSPFSATDAEAPKLDPALLTLGVPVLGICYGMQAMAAALGGKVAASGKREYGRAEIEADPGEPFFAGTPRRPIPVWMSHGDRVELPPPGFRAIARSANSPVAAMASADGRLIGIQFHPEVTHTPDGGAILGNFVRGVCGCEPTWTMRFFVEEELVAFRDRIGSDRVILGLSGGVDSSVAAILLHRAVGERLTCIFIDNGLLRKGERERVESRFREHCRLNLVTVDASSRFLAKLAGVEDPEEKRKIIGVEFIAVFEEEARRIPGVRYLAQGTLYPDVIESASFRGPSAVIKSHHNVGGLPDRMEFSLVEPFRELFKDEVREAGRELGIPEEILDRHPFPGPGLAVRILGEVTPERLSLLREADEILIQEVKRARWYAKIWQAFAVLLPVRSVGVMGDERTYENVCALRAVTSLDGMTADWARLPEELLARISNRIINEVRGINRVVYDISSKPPATIEWE